jgi:histone H3/H4
MSDIVPRQRSELQQIIDTAERELQHTSHTRFTDNGFNRLKEKISEYVVQLITESVKVARRRDSETVSPTHIEQASQYLVSSTSRKLYRHIGTVGGILLGVAGSNFLSMITSNIFTLNGVVVTVAFTLVGGVLIAAHIVKD